MADNQHYISQGYLKHFIHPKAGQNVLYPYAKGGGPQKARGIRVLASANEFYVQRIAGKPNNDLDAARQKAETLIFKNSPDDPGTLFQCITDDKFQVDHAHAVDLASAAAFLRCGSPVQIHNNAMLGLVAYQMHAFNSLRATDTLKAYQKTHGDRAEEQIEADREAFLNGELFVDVGKEHWKQFGFDSFNYTEMCARQFMSMSLTIVDAQENDFFVTSDNPVVTHSPSQPDNPGFQVKDAIVWFPISYKRALLWHHRKQHPPREVFSARQTRDKNKLVIKWCYKFIYSPLPDSWVREVAVEEKFDPCYGHYGTLNDVIGRAAPAFLPSGTPAGEIIEVGSALRAGVKVDALGI